MDSTRLRALQRVILHKNIFKKNIGSEKSVGKRPMNDIVCRMYHACSILMSLVIQ